MHAQCRSCRTQILKHTPSRPCGGRDPYAVSSRWPPPLDLLCNPATSYHQAGQIAPLEIVCFNEPNFPIPLPFLQLLLAGDRLDGGLKCSTCTRRCTRYFRANSEPRPPMLLKSEGEVVGYSDIQGAIPGARQKVDEVGHRLRAIERTRRIGPCLRRDDTERASRRPTRLSDPPLLSERDFERGAFRITPGL
jgi:hypothetical protein